MIEITTNASELVKKYNRRVESLRRSGVKVRAFAIALHELRVANLRRMIYNRTPYRSGKGAPSGELLSGEKVNGDLVYNSSNHAGIRRRMKGTYKVAPGLSKEADWEHTSFLEIIPVINRQQVAMNRRMLIGD